MNSQHVTGERELVKLLAELTDAQRANRYTLADIKVIPVRTGFEWLVLW